VTSFTYVPGCVGQSLPLQFVCRSGGSDFDPTRSTPLSTVDALLCGPALETGV
jgi:hypothetical protein